MAQAGPLRAVLLNAVSAAGPSLAVDCSSYTNITIYLTDNGTTSGGNIIVEEADWDPGPNSQQQNYVGTWSAITTIAASTLTPSSQTAYHLPAPSCYANVRVRSSGITGGGTISAVLRAT